MHPLGVKLNLPFATLEIKRGMEFSGDQILKLALAAYQSKRWDECLRYLTQCDDTSEVQALRSLVSYEKGKLLAGEGRLADARAAFSKAATCHDSSRTDIFAQERSHLINEVLGKRVRPASAYVPIWQKAKIGSAISLPSNHFNPEIWFVGCAAAYRSAYSEKSIDPLSQLVRLAKREVKTETINKLAEILIGYVFKGTPLVGRADFIVPVPSDPERHQERGYSIPLVFAERLAATCCIPLMENLVSSPDGLPELRQVPRWYRAKAISGAFSLDERIAWTKGRSVLIVDDIITSGSTVREIARVLLDGGASEVAAVALAHTEN